jgi:hypothetical protein
MFVTMVAQIIGGSRHFASHRLVSPRLASPRLNLPPKNGKASKKLKQVKKVAGQSHSSQETAGLCIFSLCCEQDH